MSEIINDYLLKSLTRPHSQDTKAIDKAVLIWQKLSKYKTKVHETEAARKDAEYMIKTLIK